MNPLPNWDSNATRQTFHRGEHELWWQGRKVQKSRQDAKRLQVAIAQTKPQVIVETGTRYGGSALMFHDLAPQGAMVISIDIDSKLGWTSRNVDTHDKNMRYVDGASTSPVVYSEVAEWCRGKRTMVVLDSDHHAPHVLEEIRFYSQLVSPGCYLVVEDGCFDFWEGEDARRGGSRIPEVGGPFMAITEWSNNHLPETHWRRGVEIESLYPISHSPGGWWMNDPHGAAHETLEAQ